VLQLEKRIRNRVKRQVEKTQREEAPADIADVPGGHSRAQPPRLAAVDPMEQEVAAKLHLAKKSRP
jgi:hypothetical protein